MRQLKFIFRIKTALLISVVIFPLANAQLYNPSESGLFSGTTNTDLDLVVGTSFSTGFGGSSMFTHSIAPAINWDASERFSVQAGTIFTSSSFSGQTQNTLFSGMDGETHQGLFQDNLYGNISYAVGYYRLNENLTLMGGAYFESSNFGYQSQMNPQALNMDAKGMMMGFDYKINDNMRIGGEINLRSGHSPYYNQFNPYSSHGFGRSPFDRSTGW